jgi:hypothetical protein
MNTQPRILKWSLIAGLVIVINLFFGYSLSLVYKQPDYNTFCPQEIYAPNVPETAVQQQQMIMCQNDYQTAENAYATNVFVTLVILGALLVFIGNFMKGNAVIASGLSIAGVLSFIIASMRYWSYASDLLHVGILAVALALLFWIAVKKFKNHSQ